MSALKEFQDAFGSDWLRQLGSPAFAAALSLAQREKLQLIRLLSDVDIETKGRTILADLRGFLCYEEALIGLGEKKEFVFQQGLPQEEYPDAAAEAAEEHLAEQQESAGITGKNFAAEFLPQVQNPPPVEKQKPKTKRKRK